MTFTLRTDPAWPPGIWHAEETDSTNLEVLRRAAGTFENGACFTADDQTAGRGRLGRQWQATRGNGLAFTLAYAHVTDDAARHLLWMHLAVALAVAELADELCSPLRKSAAAGGGGRPGIKWPNDVATLDAAGQLQKLCGVLTETAAEADGRGLRVAIGCGINVNHTRDDFPPDLRDSATSLRMLAAASDAATAEPLPLDEIRSKVLARVATRPAALRGGRIADVRDEIRARSLLAGRRIEVLHPDGRVLKGTVAGLDDTARLQLDCDDGCRVTLDSGDVTRVRPAS